MANVDVMIKVPDFNKMKDDELHGWEFSVYEKTPSLNGGLGEVIGDEAAARYYRERGRRLDESAAKDLRKQIASLTRELKKTERRLKLKTSGEYHFPGLSGTS